MVKSTHVWEVERRKVERAMGIEPTALAWEARVLPLYDARVRVQLYPNHFAGDDTVAESIELCLKPPKFL